MFTNFCNLKFIVLRQAKFRANAINTEIRLVVSVTLHLDITSFRARARALSRQIQRQRSPTIEPFNVPVPLKRYTHPRASATLPL